MKYIRNAEGNITGYKKINYCIIKFKGRYYVYGRNWIEGYPYFNLRIVAADNKKDIPTRQFLNLAGVIMNLMYISCIPALLVYFPFYAYYIGAKNFIKNGVWMTNVRFFNWINIILMIIFLIWALLR